MLDNSFENLPSEEKRDYDSQLPLIEKGLTEVFGVDDAQQHIDAIRELENIDDGMNYIMGALLAGNIKLHRFLKAIDALESDGKTG